jgi:hypothetical protein
MIGGGKVEIVKKIWSFYSAKLILALGIACLISYTTKLYVLSGLICVLLVIYYFVHSFKDPAFKKKKIVTKVFIYIFMVEFLFAGLASMGGPSATDAIRSQISSSASTK